MKKSVRTSHCDFGSLSHDKRDALICVIAKLTAIARGGQVFHCSWSATCAAWLVDDHLHVTLSWDKDGYKVDYVWLGDQMPSEKAREVANVIDSIFGEVTVH